MQDRADRVYANDGNAPLMALLNPAPRVVLDVGCGSGDNAALLRQRDPGVTIYGITASTAEAATASRRMHACWVADLEAGLPAQAKALTYDAIIFSHVLEHLRDPAEIVRQAALQLRPGGVCVIAVPNVMVWSQRAKFLVGRFEYEETGVMDSTHLRFFSYETAARQLLAKAPDLHVVENQVTGSVPLWVLRRHVLPKRLAKRIDEVGSKLLPNLFGSQILVKAVRS